MQTHYAVLILSYFTDEFGEDRFFQMQRVLRSMGENDSWISELQELKRRIAELVTTQHFSKYCECSRMRIAYIRVSGVRVSVCI